MKKRTGLILGALSAAVLIAVGAGYAVADQVAVQTPSPTASPFIVKIKDNAFSPAKLAVPVGATVTWKNQDPYAHTVTSQAKGGFDSGNLDAGKTFSTTFTKAGTVNYVCSYHASMIGTIVVGQAEQSQSQASPSGM